MSYSTGSIAGLQGFLLRLHGSVKIREVEVELRLLDRRRLQLLGLRAHRSSAAAASSSKLRP